MSANENPKKPEVQINTWADAMQTLRREIADAVVKAARVGLHPLEILGVVELVREHLWRMWKQETFKAEVKPGDKPKDPPCTAPTP